MAVVLPHSACANHPERPGRALCMACRKVVCEECATQWDGINYCVACLSRRRSSASGRSAVLPWLAWGATAVVLAWVTVHLMVFTGAMLAEAF